MSNDNAVISGSLFGALSLGVLFFNRLKTKKEASSRTQVVDYTGSCHCKAVTFSFKAPEHLTIWDCNCSLKTGQDALTLYTFNTHVAKHYFCKHCGVQAFYNPRSNPDGVGVTFACINQDQVTTSEVRYFDGDNWEQFITKSGIQQHSKT